MFKKTAVICLFLSLMQLHGATLLVETLLPAGFAEGDEAVLQSIRFMENGVEETAFDMGHILFKTSYVSPEELGESPVNISEAQNVGAEYLIRIQADFEGLKMLFQLYSVRDNLMVLSGEWLLEELGNPDEQGLPDLLFNAGVQTMNRISEEI